MPRLKSKWPFILFGSLVCGFFLTLCLRQIISDLHRFFTWQRTDARITSLIPPDRDAEESDLRPGRAEFRYSANGVERTARFPRNESITMARHSERLTSELSANQTVPAWYDPRDPAQVTLWRGVEPFPIAMILFVTPFAAFITHIARRKRDPSDQGSLAYFAYIFTSFLVIFVVANLPVGWIATNLLYLAALILLPFIIFKTARRWIAQARRRRLTPDAIRERYKTWGFAAVMLFWCTLTGAFVIDAWGTPIRVWLAQKHYRAVQAHVVKSWVVRDGKSSRAVIEYAYEVEGRQYRSRRLDLGLYRVSTNFTNAHKVVTAHAPGRPVTAYYDPDNPGHAVLHLWVSGLRWFFAIFMLPFVLIGVYGVRRTIQSFCVSDRKSAVQ